MGWLKRPLVWAVDAAGSYGFQWMLVKCAATLSAFAIGVWSYLEGFSPIEIVIVVLIVLTAVILIGEYAIRKAFWRTIAARARKLKWWGLCWDTDTAKLNQTTHASQVVVTTFRIDAENRSKRPIVIEDAYIMSGISGQRINFKIHCSVAPTPMEVSEANAIPAGARIEFAASFIDDKNANQSNNTVGVPVSAIATFWFRFSAAIKYRYHSYTGTQNETAKSLVFKASDEFVASQIDIEPKHLEKLKQRHPQPTRHS